MSSEEKKKDSSPKEGDFGGDKSGGAARVDKPSEIVADYRLLILDVLLPAIRKKNKPASHSTEFHMTFLVEALTVLSELVSREEYSLFCDAIRANRGAGVPSSSSSSSSESIRSVNYFKSLSCVHDFDSALQQILSCQSLSDNLGGIGVDFQAFHSNRGNVSAWAKRLAAMTFFPAGAGGKLQLKIQRQRSLQTGYILPAGQKLSDIREKLDSQVEQLISALTRLICSAYVSYAAGLKAGSSNLPGLPDDHVSRVSGGYQRGSFSGSASASAGSSVGVGSVHQANTARTGNEVASERRATPSVTFEVFPTSGSAGLLTRPAPAAVARLRPMSRVPGLPASSRRRGLSELSIDSLSLSIISMGSRASLSRNEVPVPPAAQHEVRHVVRLGDHPINPEEPSSRVPSRVSVYSAASVDSPVQREGLHAAERRSGEHVGAPPPLAVGVPDVVQLPVELPSWPAAGIFRAVLSSDQVGSDADADEAKGKDSGTGNDKSTEDPSSGPG